MLNFPETVEIEAHGKLLTFRITPINSVIYTVQHITSTLKNDDGMTFGYLVYQGGFLYAYAILPTDQATEESLRPDAERKYDYHVIFSSYIGPEDDVSSDRCFTEQILKTVGKVYAQHEYFNNRHPGLIDSDRFAEIYKELKRDIKKHGFDYVSPYLTPIRQTATELRDFYTNLVQDLSNLAE